MGIFPPEDNLTDYTSDEQSDLGELSDYDVNSHSNHSTRSKGSLSGGSGREMDAAQRSWEKGVRGQKSQQHSAASCMERPMLGGARSTSFSALSTSYLAPSACSHALPGTKFSLMSFQTMADVLVSRRFFTEQLLIMPRGCDSKSPAPAQAAAMISNHNLNEYAWSTCFDPQFIYELTYEGFLCIACELTGNSTCPLFILIPKLHAQRCVVDLSEHKLHISKSIRKHSKKFWLSFDMAFDKVVEACVAQHGENWLYLPMRNALRILHNNIPANHTGPRALSVELWQGPEGNAAESTLVAGELGMAYGAIYLSLTGFYQQPVSGAGSIQLAVLGAALQQAGVKLWDLGQGQGTEYKYDFGAADVPRSQFLSLVHAHRGAAEVMDTLPAPRNAQAIVNAYRTEVAEAEGKPKPGQSKLPKAEATTREPPARAVNEASTATTEVSADAGVQRATSGSSPESDSSTKREKRAAKAGAGATKAGESRRRVTVPDKIVSKELLAQLG